MSFAYRRPSSGQALLTIADAADLLAVSEKTVRRLIDRAELNAFRVGRVWRIEPAELEDFLMRRARGAKPSH